MKMHGDELGNDMIVFVDNKAIQLDVKELDTKEGWVDVFVPKIPEVKQTLQGVDQTLQDGIPANPEDVPVFDYDVERLEGEVKVARIKVPE